MGSLRANLTNAINQTAKWGYQDYMVTFFRMENSLAGFKRGGRVHREGELRI
jgi:hypothetical protein